MNNAGWRDFVHLAVHTPFSFHEGASRAKELAEEAARLGQAAIGFTDRNRVSGLIRGCKAAKEAGIQPVLGLLLDDPRDERHVMFLWAVGLDGYAELCRLSSERLLEPGFTLEAAARGIGPSVIAAAEDPDLLRILRRRLPAGRVYGALPLPAGDSGRKAARRVWQACRSLRLPVVAAMPVSCATPEERNTVALLRAIGQRRVLLPVAKRTGGKSPARSLHDGAELLRAFQGLPEALRNSRVIAEQCVCDLPLGELHFPHPRLPEGRSAFEELRGRCERGLRERYGPAPPEEARRRLAYELGVIEHLGFSGYMVIVHDIARDAWRRGVRTLGRGSAANSIVCYTLRLTDVCPLKYNLYFERFLNPERSSPPDVDLDFSWRDRDEVLRRVYRTYGDDHVAMIGTYVTFRARSALRESALARGIPGGEVSRLTRRIPYFMHGGSLAERLREAPETTDLPLDRPPWNGVVADAERILGLPRHLSIHAGGVVIAPGKITRWTGLERAAKGFVITQYDMYGIEELGLVKIDLLSQRALGVLKDASRMVRENTGTPPPVEDTGRIFTDPATRKLLRTGDTMGVFYVESPGMRVLLRKLECDNFELLTAASSVIRPGVSESGMMQQYIECVRDPAKAVYLHPKMRELLGETFGVMIYQEDVIKVAHRLAGLSLSRADSLRRAMSGKHRSPGEMERLHGEFLQGCRGNGIEEPAAREIWRQIASFAGYAFCKAHSASFAVLSMQIAYLRAHHPAEFIAAVLANGGGYYSQAAYVEEARRMGLTVRLPDVNRSSLEHRGAGRSIRLGLKGIGVLREETPGRIIAEREANGPYTGLGDFLRRIRVARDEAEALISCGAFDFTGERRPTMLRNLRAAFDSMRVGPGPLAAGVEDPFSDLNPAPDWTAEEKWAAERRLLGFSPGPHPLSLLALPSDGCSPARALEGNIGKQVAMIGWAYAHKRITTRARRETMLFLSLEDLTGTFEATLFPRVYRRYAPILRGHGPFRIEGRVEEDHGVATLVARRVERVGRPAAHATRRRTRE